ncbi:hypothetical protein HI914_01267 [Erysiphe necator]|nr:hypothetical protein HI914_01267 [Erysiphe necator]
MQHTSPLRMFMPTRRMMIVPKEDQSGTSTLNIPKLSNILKTDGTKPAHFITHRLRKLKKIPPELIPLGIVVGIAVGFAGYSLAKKLWVDKTMRLSRQNRRE